MARRFSPARFTQTTNPAVFTFSPWPIQIFPSSVWPNLNPPSAARTIPTGFLTTVVDTTAIGAGARLIPTSFTTVVKEE